MKTILTLLIGLLFRIGFSQTIALETFATNLSSPVNIKNAGDERLFVVELPGHIQILDAEGTMNPIAFLDINDRVSNAGGERGLLAMAFHPNYATNGFFYVNYIDNSQNTVISRFTRSTLGTADPNSEVILLNINQPFSNHNGGDLHFGPDGFLYISLGDGGSAGDPGNRAQDLNQFLGKMLRIDVNSAENGTNYAIPPNNPFLGTAGALDEIWAYGLRNPFKFSFDSANGNLWIADVGQGQIEEIDRVTTVNGGENYGWNCFEGTSVYDASENCETINHTTPVAEYNHSNGRCSITGGYVYRGSQYASLEGLYFFSDFCSNEIGYVEEISENNFSITFVDDFSIGGASAFGEDSTGELYVAGVNGGSVFKIIDTDLSVNQNTFTQIEMYPNPAQDQLHFKIEDVSTPIQSIDIYALNGSLLLSNTKTETELETISINNLSSGLYIVNIVDTNGANTKRKLIIK